MNEFYLMENIVLSLMKQDCVTLTLLYFTSIIVVSPLRAASLTSEFLHVMFHTCIILVGQSIPAFTVFPF